ncbi:MAG: PD-(D/E)XK nuclease family protein [Dolichospermum sp.]
MTYCFVQSKGQNKIIKFTYSEQQHQKTAQELNQLLNNLTKWVTDYEHNTPLPLKESDESCESCEFAVRCHRQKNQEITMNINQHFPKLEDIVEVSL